MSPVLRELNGYRAVVCVCVSVSVMQRTTKRTQTPRAYTGHIAPGRFFKWHTTRRQEREWPCGRAAVESTTVQLIYLAVRASFGLLAWNTVGPGL